MVSFGAFPFAAGLVATLTSSSGTEVVAALAAGNGTVVASRTTRANSQISMQLGRCPGRITLVAARAVRAGRHMIDALANSVASVVTTGAGRGRRESTVVSLGAFPFAAGLVATLASSSGTEVVAALAAGNGTVVASRTTCAHRHIGMKLGWRPSRVALVASGAIGRRADVIGPFAGGLGPVVTTGAGGRTAERVVIGLRAGPAGGGLVATFATGGGRNVGRRLACRYGAVVTTRAARGNRHIDMELGRQPATRCVLVAGRAIGAGADVICILAGCLAAIVTTRAHGC